MTFLLVSKSSGRDGLVLLGCRLNWWAPMNNPRQRIRTRIFLPYNTKTERALTITNPSHGHRQLYRLRSCICIHLWPINIKISPAQRFYSKNDVLICCNMKHTNADASGMGFLHFLRPYWAWYTDACHPLHGLVRCVSLCFSSGLTNGCTDLKMERNCFQTIHDALNVVLLKHLMM